jgi:hypothetical protein
LHGSCFVWSCLADEETLYIRNSMEEEEEEEEEGWRDGGREGGRAGRR